MLALVLRNKSKRSSDKRYVPVEGVFVVMCAGSKSRALFSCSSPLSGCQGCEMTGYMIDVLTQNVAPMSAVTAPMQGRCGVSNLLAIRKCTNARIGPLPVVYNTWRCYDKF